MCFLVAHGGKLSANGTTFSQEKKILAKINESLLYNENFKQTESYICYSTYIYVNGYSNQSLLSSVGSFHGTNELRLFVNISTYEGDEAGDYFVIVYADTFDQFILAVCSLHFYILASYTLAHSTIWYVQTLQILTTGNTSVI